MPHARWRILYAPAAVIGALLALAMVGTVAAQSPTPTATPTPQAGGPTPPDRFYGNVTLNGQPAPNGTAVVARVGSNSCGTGTVTATGNVSTYVVDVASSFTQPGCGTDGATVTFTVGGAPASQTGTFQTGTFTNLNLTAQAATPTPSPTVVRTPSPSPTVVRTPSPTVVRTPTAAPTAQRPAASPAAQRPAAAAAPALPRTGAGTTNSQAPLWLILAAVLVAGIGALVFARRRA